MCPLHTNPVTSAAPSGSTMSVAAQIAHCALCAALLFQFSLPILPPTQPDRWIGQHRVQLLSCATRRKSPPYLSFGNRQLGRDLIDCQVHPHRVTHWCHMLTPLHRGSPRCGDFADSATTGRLATCCWCQGLPSARCSSARTQRGRPHLRCCFRCWPSES